MEALQCIKCTIQHYLLFRDPAPSSKSEMEETTDEELENDLECDEESDVEVFSKSWDRLLIDDDDNSEAK